MISINYSVISSKRVVIDKELSIRSNKIHVFRYFHWNAYTHTDVERYLSSLVS